MQKKQKKVKKWIDIYIIYIKIQTQNFTQINKYNTFVLCKYVTYIYNPFYELYL